MLVTCGIWINISLLDITVSSKRPRLFLGSKGVDFMSSNIVVENFALLRYIMEVDNLTSYLFIILTNSLVSF